MKKVITFLTLTCALTLTSHLHAQGKFEGFIYTGTTISTFRGDTDRFADDLSMEMLSETGHDFNFHKRTRHFGTNLGNIGGGVSYSFNHWFSVQAGLELIPKGVKYVGKTTYYSGYYPPTSTRLDVSTIFAINYLEFPISVKLSARSKNNTDRPYLYFKAGIAPSKNIVSELRIETIVDDGVLDGEYDSESDSEEISFIKESDFCQFYVLGISLNKLAIETKYDRGTSNVINEENAYYKFYNSSVSINFVFQF